MTTPDRFPEECDRCGIETRVTIMSKFNTDILCMRCKDEERRHPDYEYASQREVEAVRRGNMNFPGVGWPGKTGRISGYGERDLKKRAEEKKRESESIPEKGER